MITQSFDANQFNLISFLNHFKSNEFNWQGSNTHCFRLIRCRDEWNGDHSDYYGELNASKPSSKLKKSSKFLGSEFGLRVSKDAETEKKKKENKKRDKSWQFFFYGWPDERNRGAEADALPCHNRENHPWGVRSAYKMKRGRAERRFETWRWDVPAVGCWWPPPRPPRPLCSYSSSPSSRGSTPVKSTPRLKLNAGGSSRLGPLEPDVPPSFIYPKVWCWFRIIHFHVDWFSRIL